MKATYVVHGFVQGVGYRAYVKGLAEKLGIGGIVMNQEDGSVLIIAQAPGADIEKFEKALKISPKHGMEVMHIEKQYENDEGNRAEIDFDSFQII